MVWETALVWLGKQLGPALAGSVISRLKMTDKAEQRLDRVTSLITAGSTAIEAFQKVFGSDFDKAVIAAQREVKPTWTYQAGQEDYVRVEPRQSGREAALQSLRDELNVNLDRIARSSDVNGEKTLSHFLGMFNLWMSRYRQLIGREEDAEKTFRTIESLLDGSRKTFADAFRLLQQTGLGVTGAFLVIQAGMLASSAGVGVIAGIWMWLFGIPYVQIGTFAVSGALLIALSRVKFKSANSLSTSVAAAYKLLDRASDKT
jgi:hypothetical protein